MPRCKNSSGPLPPKIHEKSHISIFSLRVYPHSRRGAERKRQGEGRWSFPPKTALKRSDLTKKFQCRYSLTEAERKESPDKIDVLSKRESFYMFEHIILDISIHTVRVETLCGKPLKSLVDYGMEITRSAALPYWSMGVGNCRHPCGAVVMVYNDLL